MREWVMGLLVVGLALAATGAAAEIPDTADGLKAQMDAAVAAAKAGDKEKLAELVKGLILPDHEAWFKEVFGDELGAALAKEYAGQLEGFEQGVGGFFTKLVDKQPFEISVKKLEKADDPDARGAQRSALAAMKKPVPLYDVSFRGDNVGMSLWSFVYSKGAFRLAGKMRAAAKN